MLAVHVNDDAFESERAYRDARAWLDWSFGSRRWRRHRRFAASLQPIEYAIERRPRIGTDGASIASADAGGAHLVATLQPDGGLLRQLRRARLQRLDDGVDL